MEYYLIFFYFLDLFAAEASIKQEINSTFGIQLIYDNF